MLESPGRSERRGCRRDDLLSKSVAVPLLHQRLTVREVVDSNTHGDNKWGLSGYKVPRFFLKET